ncbi:metallophosphoesterase [Pantoea septica]|uniref:metallophosphoesterase n=1 Tax=Pantoea septica TaxID=472695 RepID=UPI0023F6CDA1|nr:metallophosphoesterase [Pantoea septica]
MITRKESEQLDERIKTLLATGMPGRKIAKELGIAERTYYYHRAALARQGFSPEHNMTHTVPDGFKVKGVSTLYNKEGQVAGQWVKSTEDKERQFQLMMETVAAMCDKLPRVRPITAPSSALQNTDLLNLLVISDYHLGMLSWGEETGDDWNLEIAEKLLVDWFRAAISQAPPAERVVFANLGDLLHFDGMMPVTPASRHVLDADSRFALVVRSAIRVIRNCIDMLLAKHSQVHVIMAEGNHDESSSVWLREMLAALYEKEPRITVDRTPDPYYCVEHGETSLFFHHGHKARIGQLPQIFAAKFRDVFGRTKFSYGHCGHLHHAKVDESNLMVMEQHRTLAAKDAYASRGGWLSGRDAKVITYHRTFGKVGEIVISPEMCK